MFIRKTGVFVDGDEKTISMNFVVPEGMTEDQEVKFPCTDVSTQDYPESGDAIDILHIAKNTRRSIVLNGAPTINLDADSNSEEGDEIALVFTADESNRTVTFGAAFVPADTFTVAATKTAVIIFRYMLGLGFVETSRIAPAID